MANMVVGDIGDLEFSELVTAIRCSTVSSVMLHDWRVLADALGIQPVTVNSLEEDLLREKKRNSDVIKEILFQWRSKHSTDKSATLGALVEIIEEKCKWKALAELLQEILLKKAVKWDDLYEKQKMDILKSPVKFQNRITTLHQIGDELGHDKMGKIMQAHFHGDVMRTAVEGNMWLLFKGKEEDDQVGQAPCYMERTLTLQRKLDAKIFHAKCFDVFICEGFNSEELANLVKPANIENSTSQVWEITARYILLERNEDFEIIQRRWRPTDPSIHRIKKENGKYFWEGTLGDVHLIQQHLVEEPEEFTERQIVEQTLQNFHSKPIAVTGTSGMGKSWLLSHLSQLVKLNYRNRHIIHLTCSKLFATGEKEREELGSLTGIKRMLSKVATTNKLGKEILFELMSCEAVQFEVFLDAFDEIPSSQIPFAKKMLELLSESNNLRAFISIRKEASDDIQQTIDVISWNIKPFTEEEQTAFFLDYWTDAFKTRNHARVKEFVDSFVQHVRSQDVNQAEITGEKDFAGVPLHFYMLAHVYMEDARQYVTSSDGELKLSYQFSTLQSLYKRFMEIKFQDLEESMKQETKRTHFLAAVRLLFPDWEDKLEKILKPQGSEAEDVEHQLLLSLGILQSVNPPECLHRSFAEYLLADFIASNLREPQFIKHCPEFAQFLFEAVLASTTSPHGATITPTRDDPIIQEFIMAVQSSSIWVRIEAEYKKMVEALGMQDTYPVIEFEDEWDLCVLLSDWATTNGDKATYRKLMQILRWELKWPTDVIDQLLKLPSTQKLGYLHANICHFLDALLIDQDHTVGFQQLFGQPLESFQISPNQTEGASQFFENSVKCTAGGLGNLFKLLTAISAHTVNYTELQSYQWASLLVEAARLDTSFFEPVVDFIESLYEMKLFEFDFHLSTWGQYYVTPLHEAVALGNRPVVEYIIRKYDRNINSALEGLLLHSVSFTVKQSEAVVNTKIEIIRFLLKNNIDIRLNEPIAIFDEQDIHQVRAVVAHGIHVKLFTLLIELGAKTENSFDVDRFGDCVLPHYKPYDIDDLVDYLEKQGLLELLFRTNGGGFKSVRLLTLWDALTPKAFRKLKSHQSVSLYDFGDTSTIFRAIVSSRWKGDMVQSFVETLDCVNFGDEEGMTMLMHAAACKSYSVIKYLLSAGANVNAKSRSGESPLSQALKANSNSPGDPALTHECVALLLDGGADVNAKDVDDATVLDNLKILDPAQKLQSRTVVLLFKKSTEKTALTRKRSRRNSRKCVVM